MVLKNDQQYCKCGCKKIIPKFSKWGRKLKYYNGHNRLSYMYTEDERKLYLRRYQIKKWRNRRQKYEQEIVFGDWNSSVVHC